MILERRRAWCKECRARRRAVALPSLASPWRATSTSIRTQARSASARSSRSGGCAGRRAARSGPLAAAPPRGSAHERVHHLLLSPVHRDLPSLWMCADALAPGTSRPRASFTGGKLWSCGVAAVLPDRSEVAVVSTTVENGSSVIGTGRPSLATGGKELDTLRLRLGVVGGGLSPRRSILLLT